MKIKILILCFFLAMGSSFSYADTQTHRSAAEELLRLTNPDRMLEQMWGQVKQMANQQFQQMGAPEEYRPVLEKHTKRMFQVMQQYLSFENIKDDLIAIYVNTYTEDEIRAIIDFYKTPTGQVFLEKMPRLMQETLAVTQKKMPVIIEEVQRISKELEAEIKELEKQ